MKNANVRHLEVGVKRELGLPGEGRTQVYQRQGGRVQMSPNFYEQNKSHSAKTELKKAQKPRT